MMKEREGLVARLILWIMVGPLCFALQLCAAESIKDLLPSDNQVPGWARSAKIRVFNASNLWEYIDGAADGYLVYNFQQVVTADYKNGKTQVVVDIYEMKNPLNAFGVYSVERMPNYHFVNMGVQGYLEGSALNFWKGKYYVKVVTFQESDKLKDVLLSLGKIVANKITGKFSDSPILKRLPTKNMVVNSIKYIAKDVLGQSYLSNGFTAEYTLGGKKATAFLIDSPTIESAKKSYEAYKKYLGARGKIEMLSKLGKEAFSGQDSFYGKVIAFYDSKGVAGILNVSDNQTAVKLLQEVAAKKK